MELENKDMITQVEELEKQDPTPTEMQEEAFLPELPPEELPADLTPEVKEALEEDLGEIMEDIQEDIQEAEEEETLLTLLAVEAVSDYNDSELLCKLAIWLLARQK